MIPQILSLGPVPINSFGLMVALAVLVGIVVLERSFRMQSLNPAWAERYALSAGLSGIVGARLWYMGENWATVRLDFWGSLFAGAGFTFYGGFIFASLVLLIMVRVDGIRLHRLMDSVGPALAIGYAIGRIGCQLAGDGDYGIPTNSFIGMSYAQGVVPTPPNVMVFPTPFFESVMSVGIFLFLFRIEEKGLYVAPYLRFGWYLTLMSIERFLIEFIRVNPRLMYGLSEAQLVAIVLGVLGSAFILVVQMRRKEA